MTSLFLGFHPATRPVTWRILVAQAYLYRAIIGLSQHDRASQEIEVVPWEEITALEYAAFDWRVRGDGNLEDDQQSIEWSGEEPEAPLAAAESYLREQVGVLRFRKGFPTVSL